MHPQRLLLAVAVLLPSLAAAGCAGKLEPIFKPLDPPVAWPSPPLPTKIRFVGVLRTSSDLKARPKPFQALNDLLFGKRPPAPLFGPRKAVCTVDGERLWVADAGGRCVHVFDLARRTYEKVTHAGDTPLLGPVDVCFGERDTVYVCDSEGVAIYRYSAGTAHFRDVLRTPEEILRPAALDVDVATGELYVVDVLDHNVKVLTPNGSLRRIIGQRGSQPGQFNFPTAIAIDKDLIWVADTGNQRVQGLSRSGEPRTVFGQAGDAPGDLALPKGVAVDSAGHVYVVDARFENVQVFDRMGRLLLFFGEEGTKPGQFWLPTGISIDTRDRIWVCDSYNRRVQVFEYVGSPVQSVSTEP